MRDRRDGAQSRRRPAGVSFTQLRGDGRKREQAMVEQKTARMLSARCGEIRMVEAKSEATVDAGKERRTDRIRNGDGRLSGEPADGGGDRHSNQGRNRSDPQ